MEVLVKLLLTAFTPFGGESINPALEAVKLVKDKIANLDIIKLEVPTVFRKSVHTVIEAMEREKPDFVLCVGQAGGREGITPERIAINIDDARIPDNEGNQPIDRTIYPDGENAYFSNLPVKAMVEAIKEEGLISSLSNSAGTYVPYIPEQTEDKPNKPSMPLKDIVKGLEAAIRAIAENEKDIKVIGGAEC